MRISSKVSVFTEQTVKKSQDIQQLKRNKPLVSGVAANRRSSFEVSETHCEASDSLLVDSIAQ